MHEQGFDESHPLWIMRRTMIDLIRQLGECRNR
jgi:acyl-ACP thioesterase